jgi:hypothetical protein
MEKETEKKEISFIDNEEKIEDIEVIQNEDKKMKKDNLYKQFLNEERHLTKDIKKHEFFEWRNKEKVLFFISYNNS